MGGLGRGRPLQGGKKKREGEGAFVYKDQLIPRVLRNLLRGKGKGK